MKKVYSKRIGGEVFALDAAQLNVFEKSGYKVPTPEAVIADAGAIRIMPRRTSGRMRYSILKQVFFPSAFLMQY